MNQEKIQGLIRQAEQRNLKIEIIFQDSQRDIIRLEDQSLETGQDQGLGFRVLVDGKEGLGFTSDFSQTGLDLALNQALEIAREKEPDPNFVLAQPFQNQAISLKPRNFPDSRQALEFLQKIKSNCPEKVSIRSAWFSKSNLNQIIANTQGILVGFRKDTAMIILGLVGEQNGEKQSVYDDVWVNDFSNLDPREIIRPCLEKLFKKFGGRPCPTGKYTIVFDPQITAQILEVLSSAFDAKQIIYNQSFLKDKFQKVVAPSFVNLIDDGQLFLDGWDAPRTSPCDSEGIPSSKKFLIKEGRISSWLHSLWSAKTLEMEPTGNGFRSYSEPITIQPANLYLETQELLDPKEILERVNQGIYLDNLMGLHNVDLASGNFSVGAEGFLIENGQLSRPVQGITLAGNLAEFLANIIMVGNDQRFYPDGIAGQTLAVSNLTIAGE